MSENRGIRFTNVKSEVAGITAVGNTAKQEFGKKNVLCASVGAAIGVGILSLLGCTESSQRFAGSENACIVSPTQTDRNVSDVANGGELRLEGGIRVQVSVNPDAGSDGEVLFQIEGGSSGTAPNQGSVTINGITFTICAIDEDEDGAWAIVNTSIPRAEEEAPEPFCGIENPDDMAGARSMARYEEVFFAPGKSMMVSTIGFDGVDIEWQSEYGTPEGSESVLSGTSLESDVLGVPVIGKLCSTYSAGGSSYALFVFTPPPISQCPGVINTTELTITGNVDSSIEQTSTTRRGDILDTNLDTFSYVASGPCSHYRPDTIVSFESTFSPPLAPSEEQQTISFMEDGMQVAGLNLEAGILALSRTLDFVFLHTAGEEASGLVRTAAGDVAEVGVTLVRGITPEPTPENPEQMRIELEVWDEGISRYRSSAPLTVLMSPGFMNYNGYSPNGFPINVGITLAPDSALQIVLGGETMVIDLNRAQLFYTGRYAHTDRYVFEVVYSEDGISRLKAYKTMVP